MKDNKQLSFSVVPFIEDSIPAFTEDEVRGQEWIANGKKNDYPNWLYSLYTDSATLQTLIDGVVDYVGGDEINMNFDLGWGKNKVNRLGMTINDLVGVCATDYCVFGGFYLQVIRNTVGKVSELYWLDYRYVRSDKKNNTFYYSEDFAKDKTYGRCKCLVYPKFIPDFDDNVSIFFCKRPQTRGTYPLPRYSGALKPIMTDIKINNFNLNEVNNNFTVSAVINMNNGIPDEATKDKIERDLEEKFTGSENAGRFLVSYNEDKDHAAEITRLNTDDFDKRYEALQARTQSQIYVAFRATPNLFGLPNQTTGFNAQEYQSAYSLFYRTVIRPIQNQIVDALDKITGMNGSIEIVPFTLNLDTNANNVE